MSHSDTVHSSYASRDPATQAPAHGRRGCLLAVAAATLLAACAAPEKPVTTPVTLTLVAAPDTNPDAQGRASPLVTRYYVLKAPGAFELADFFALQDKDTATLGADLVQREEVVLRPGEQRAVRMTLAADARPSTGWVPGPWQAGLVLHTTNNIGSNPQHLVGRFHDQAQ